MGERNGVIWTIPGLLTPCCWHGALTSNTTNISSTPSLTMGIVFLKGMQRHTRTRTWRSAWQRDGPHMCQHRHPPKTLAHAQNPYPALTSERREMNAQTHIRTQTSERGMRECGGKQVHGGWQTDSVSDPPSLVCCRLWVLTISSSLPQWKATSSTFLNIASTAWTISLHLPHICSLLFTWLMYQCNTFCILILKGIVKSFWNLFFVSSSCRQWLSYFLVWNRRLKWCQGS